MASRTTTTSNIGSSRRKVLQTYSLVWTDGSIDQSEEDWQQKFVQVQDVVNDVNIFTESDECIQFLKMIDSGSEKVFLITSAFLGRDLVPEIHDMPQVDTIYIFCGNKSRQMEWAKGWAKIQ
ncbi:unnamed protein product, partial [Rotaria sp. Silwood1]